MCGCVDCGGTKLHTVDVGVLSVVGQSCTRLMCGCVDCGGTKLHTVDVWVC